MARDALELEDVLLLGVGLIIGLQIVRFVQSAGGGFQFQGTAPGTGGLLSAVPMTVSPGGRAFIQSNEGFSLKPYADAGGQSVYWGHRITAQDPAITGTMAQAQEFFANDIANVESAIDNSVTVALTQDQYDALADLAYNIGTGAFQSSTLVRVLNQGNYQAASQQILAWNKGGTHTARRQAEQARFNGTG